MSLIDIIFGTDGIFDSITNKHVHELVFSMAPHEQIMLFLWILDEVDGKSFM